MSYLFVSDLMICRFLHFVRFLEEYLMKRVVWDETGFRMVISLTDGSEPMMCWLVSECGGE